MTRPDSFPDFISGFRKLNSEFTPVTYLNQPDSITFLIAAQWLYAPDFVSYRSGVFHTELPDGLSKGKRAAIDQWIISYGGDIPRVERAANTIVLWDFFGILDITPFEREVDQLAATLARVWRALLQAELPDRSFRVESYAAEEDDMDTPMVTFFSDPDVND